MAAEERGCQVAVAAAGGAADVAGARSGESSEATQVGPINHVWLIQLTLRVVHSAVEEDSLSPNFSERCTEENSATAFVYKFF